MAQEPRLPDRSQDPASRQLAALRDFFWGPDAGALEAAAAELGRALAQTPPPEDWPAAEYAFNRLFVGPASPQAPPYASYYLENPPRLLGRPALEARHVYQMAGLVPALGENLPDDHLCLELDAAYQLRHAALTSGQPDLAHLYAFFLIDHLALWTPPFVRRLLEQPACGASFSWAARSLENWLEEECAWLHPPRNLSRSQVGAGSPPSSAWR
ncbi:MAG: molecular chaperone TorD family protein [Deltaproteobacteria bacterium]|nr:molecular chaperone TorD family protein [Deltaproteobacteria bacterium]